ncbi:MAG: glycosyltransferase involved in cell wall biosynthesis [Planctomycetota bacterium]|jgi:glycosyltransferase involved in cell wall biosynthesis
MAFFIAYFYTMKLAYSFIIPVYNRPDEVAELLESLVAMDTALPSEILIIEDGSYVTCKHVCEKYAGQLNIKYFLKKNTGPGDSRNYGMKQAKGSYFIILDSDCILPPHYLATVDSYLTRNYVDCYGGADAAHDSFTPLQKAINYTMTSFFTTGGIRGSRKSVTKFEPRSFNMGLSKEVFEATGGYANIHPGEDPDLSHRIMKLGYKTAFLPAAYVFHKRRISWEKFYQQVRKFGLVRPILSRWHPEAAKLTFWLPTMFVLFVLLSVLFSAISSIKFIIPLALYLVLLFVDSAIRNKSLSVAALSIAAIFVQFFGYGLGFLKSTYYVRFQGKDPETQFPFLFFK